MRPILKLLLAILVASSSSAQTSDKIIIGKRDTIHSKILNEDRDVWVYTPGMRKGAPPAGQRYPVLYVLDGDGHFESVVGLVQQLGQSNAMIPEMIVVAILNTDRTRDLTPTHILSDPPMMDSNFSMSTGGGENFAAFIEKELMPHVEAHYPTQPFKLLIGHSFGGLEVMHILTNHTRLFNAYIAIDPSMWYDKERFLKTTEAKLAAQKFDGTSLFIGIANTMPNGMTLDKMKKDSSSDTRHIRSIFALDRFIKANAKNGLRFNSKYYADDNHGSVPLITEYDGLRFIFNWYALNLTPDEFEKPGTAFIQKMKTHYENVSKQMGYKVSPQESLINSIGYYTLSKNDLEKALALLKMNVENYPESGNVYDAYGDALLAAKDSTAAINNFEKAFAITKNEDIKQKLDRIRSKSTYTASSKDLEKYTGEYFFESVNLTAKVYMKANALWVFAAGQGDFEMIPQQADVFTLKGVPGYTLKFEMKDNKPLVLTSVQPNGTFKGVVKK